MFKNTNLKLMVLVLAISVVLFGANVQADDAQLTIATGGAGGPYHTIATGLAEIWNSNIEGINVSVASTGASVINNRMIEGNKADLAFAMSDVCYYAKEGVEMFDEPLENVRGFASAHTNFVQLVTTKDSGIESVWDLKGKRVGVGAPGSGTELNANRVLAAHDISYGDLGKADFLGYAESCEQLSNRNIDAAFLTGGLPIASITELATTQDIKIVPIEKEVINEMKKEFPVYISAEIPGGTYKGVEDAVNTLAMKNYMLVNKDIDEELAYKLVSVMFNNLDELYSYHNAAKMIELETALEAMTLELHPGVKKFYEEEGLVE